MPKHIQKSFTNATQKIKISTKQIQSDPRRGCSHLKTTSFAANGKENENDGVRSSDDTVRFLFENFKSLYQEDFHCEEVTTKKVRNESFLFDKSTASKNQTKPQIFSGEDSSTAGETEEIGADDSSAQDDFIAILTYSPSPHEEFRRSMKEMVEVHLERDGKVDWDFLEKLLFRYLDLNNEKSYRYILRAFVDLVVVLRENDWRFPARRRPWRWNGGGGRKAAERGDVLI
ncbi:hypothetical protein DH2020_013309 [Rehmannia glutinosa]|uniref:Transcription repressor n=1 Tax=Rehmannia glutinosa TaxID=99300 RepID=A0ABR0X5H1_REHGL